MKRITLKAISIRNFKGIKQLDFQFRGSQVFIQGDNATGKTTIFDAFTWLLFGKDSTDRREFGIIPLDSENQPLQKVDNEVFAVLDEDGAEITLKRIHHQKWVKRRGSTETVYDGNETLFFYNDVPQKASEYKQKIDTIMDEGIFKLVTSPLYFNSLPWLDRREVLTSMAGDVPLGDILDKLNGQMEELSEVLGKGKKLEEYKLEISSKKKKIKDSLSGIPTRIDEINRSIPEEVNEKAITKEIDEKQKAIEDIDQQIADVRKESDSIVKAFNSLRESKRELQIKADELNRTRENELTKSFYANQETRTKIEYSIQDLERKIQNKKRQVDFETKGMEVDQENMTNLRTEWQKINAEKLDFDEYDFSCPTCKRPYEATDTEAKKAEMQKDFTDDKKSRLNKVHNQGVELRARVERSQGNIKELNQQISELEDQLSEAKESLANNPIGDKPDLESDLKGNKEYQGILASIEELNEKLSEPVKDSDISSHQEMKRTINAALDELKRKLAINETRKKSYERIDELKAEEKKLAQQLADLEKTEFTIQQYTKARTDLIEERVNSKFKLARFKMFKQNINGSEEPTCETLVDGVPFSDANNAARINYGLDIINALSSHYGVSAPVFIDNKESVNELIPCDSQLINLVVTKDKELTLA